MKEIYILSKYKIQALEKENFPAEFLIDDLLDILMNNSTKIIDNFNLIEENLTHGDVKYVYTLLLKLKYKKK
jgi:hypothetical protein